MIDNESYKEIIENMIFSNNEEYVDTLISILRNKVLINIQKRLISPGTHYASYPKTINTLMEKIDKELESRE